MISSRSTHTLPRLVSTLFSRFYLGAVHPWRDRCRETAFRYLSQSQWWSTERLESERWQRLHRMLTHAHANVPLYRDRLTALGAEPGDIRTPSDFARLPILTKADIQEHAARLRATGGYKAHGTYTNHTGGSTGTPLSFRQDDAYRAWSMAELDRDFTMCGYRRGWRQAFLWGSDYDAKAHAGLGGRLRDMARNLHWVDTFDLTADTLRRAAAELAAFDPQLLVGYVSSVTLLAQVIREEGLRGPKPRAIQTSAETLTPTARRLIEDTFGARCFDRYGCREVGNLAHECDAHTGLHLLVENNYIEFVDDAGEPVAPGEVGHIVATNLRNRAMPLIRYAVGDLGVPSSARCSCGRGLPMMERVQGRVSDVIVTPAGRLLHGEFFTHLFYGASGVRQFQVEQRTLTELDVRMVADSDVAYETARARIGDLILRHGDTAFQLTFARVPHIPARRSGKYCFTLSHVPVTFRRNSSHALA